MLVEAESELQWQRGIFVKQGSDGRVYSSGSPGLHSKRDAKQQTWSRMEDCTRGSSVLGRRVAGTGKYNQTAAQKLGTWNVMARAIMMRLETHKACDARAGDPGRSYHADSSSGKSRKCSMHRQLHKLLRSRQCARTRVVRGWNCGQGRPVNERG